MARIRNIRLTHKVMYEEFAEAVRDLIGKERLWGRYLASENEWGKMFGVSRETVRRGMRLLEEQGVVSRQQGRGTLALPKRKVAGRNGSLRVAVGYSRAGIGEGYVSRIVTGLSDASSRINAALTFVNLMGPEARRKLHLDMRAGAYDAVALLSFTDRAYLEDMLRIWSGPMVLMDHYFSDLPVAGVMDDGEGGARQAIEHFVALGHRRIGFIDIGRRELNPWRYAGYASALEAAGLAVDLRLVVPSFSSFEAGCLAAERLLDMSDPPTAILAFDDLRAWGALRALEARGMEAGRDLALAGFSDRAERPGFSDLLTRVRFDARDIGRLAFGRLRKQKEGKATPGGLTLVPTELDVRESSGNGPGRNKRGFRHERVQKEGTMKYARAAMMAIFAAGLVQGEPVPQVRTERPRLIWRAKAWDGPSVERLKGWMRRPEYASNADKLGRDGVTGALRYWALDDAEAGKRAVKWLKELQAPSGSKESVTYAGEKLVNHAMIYDWLRDHPDFADPADRQGAIAYFEWWGERFMRHNSPGVVPFYSRNTGACLGLTAIAIALHGDSPKADGFLAHAFKDFRGNIGTIREAEDGATGGGSYGLVHQFGATAQTAAAWRSGTDWDAAQWIREHQGNWLERQLLWQIWATYPNGWLWKEGDLWSGSHRDRNDHALSVAAVSDMYRNGQGRAHHEAMIRRWKMGGTYYRWRLLWFYLYNNPDIPVRPLDALGRADVFSPNLHGFVCWRDSWRDDATIVHFKAGDNVDHHGSWDTGKFTLWKKAPLAIKNGYYRGFRSSVHKYYRSPWSANVVIFDGPKAHGYQLGVLSGPMHGRASWETWRARRKTLHPIGGRLLKHEANERYARAVADLSGSTHPDDSTWIRELVFLDYKYLLVLDRVEPGPGVATRWILHSIHEPTIDAKNKQVLIENGDARLFCRTLLPEGARIEKIGGGGKAFVHKNEQGKLVEWKHQADAPERILGQGRFDVVPSDPFAETVYLHVLFPTATRTEVMPDCSVSRKGDDYTVTVGNLTHTFPAP